MNKDLAQGAKSQNQIQKNRKEINPKNQKRKQIKIKKKLKMKKKLKNYQKRKLCQMIIFVILEKF